MDSRQVHQAVGTAHAAILWEANVYSVTIYMQHNLYVGCKGILLTWEDFDSQPTTLHIYT